MGSYSINRQCSVSLLARMNFLLASLGFLAVATGLPFPQEFRSSPSQAPPAIYSLDRPLENRRGFRVQQLVPEGNTLTKVVIQVPNEPSQRTQEGFQGNPIVQHYYPDNGQQQQQVIQYQDVPQKIQYVPQGVPENMPHLFLPAQPVAQAVEQVPQGVHYSVQRAEQLPQKIQQPFEVPVQQVNAQPVNQNKFVQKVAQASSDVNKPGIQGHNVHKISYTDGQSVVNGQQSVSVQPAVLQTSKDPGVNQEINNKVVQPVAQFVHSEARPVNNIPLDQNAQQVQYGGVQQAQDSRNPPKEQTVQEAPKDNPQRIPGVPQVTDQQPRTEPISVTVQHGTNDVQNIRQGEPNTEQQQFVHQNLVQVANEQSQTVQGSENISAPQIIQQSDVQREPVAHPIVQVIQHGVQGVQVIRDGEQNKKHVEKQETSSQFPQAGQKVDNVIAIPQVPSKHNDQRAPTGVHQQPVVMVQHGPSGVHIIRQEEAQQPIYHNQEIIQSTLTSQKRVNIAPATISQGVQHISNEDSHTPQGTQALFYGDVQKTRPAQGHLPYEAANAVPQNPAHQSMPLQAKPTIQAAKPSNPTHQVTHFSFGFQDHSSVIKQENQKIEAAPQALASPEIQTKPHHPEPVWNNVLQLPPSLHNVAQNVVAEVPQVSHSIKEVSHGVQAIPAAVEQASQGVQQLTQGVQQVLQGVEQAKPAADGVRNVYQGIRNSIHPAILSAEAHVNSIQREPVHSPQLQEVLDQIKLVRQKQESQRSQAALSQQESRLDQENRQIPLQEEDSQQQYQKPFQSGFHPFQNPGQRGQPARPQYGNRTPVQSAPVNQIYDNTPHRDESPAEDDAEPTPIPIIRFENSVGPDGTYQWSYEAGNGIKAQENGLLRNRGDPDKESIAVHGEYSYTGPDGIFYSVEYIADENGFQPLGRHLPTQPPIPEALQKAIDEHMAILATAAPDTDEQVEEPNQTDNKLASSQNKYNFSQRVS